MGKDAGDRIGDIARQAKESVNTYVVPEAKKAEIDGLAGELTSDFRRKDYKAVLEDLYAIRAILGEAIGKPVPNFFRMGYYVTYSDKPLPDMPVDELNDFLKKYLDDNFMLAFIKDAERALKYSAKRSQDNMRAAVEALRAAAPV